MPVQPGILALGTTDHCYLELDLRTGTDARGLVADAASLARELITTAGVNVVVGVRPSLWRTVAHADEVPDGVDDWTDDVVGPDGFTMPATPHDVWVWIAGGSRTAVFDSGKHAVTALSRFATVAGEIGGWVYRHDRDLTGFVDGTENPDLLEAPSIVTVPDGRPGAGSSVVLFQLWPHDAPAWDAQPVPAQERVIGRTKPDSVELDDEHQPDDSHVSRTTVDVDGAELDIFRRNVAYGGVTDHGTVFVGFSHDQWRMAEMLRRMAGVGDGVRCALTRYTRPVTGAYYVVPSVGALGRLAPEPPDD